MTRARPGFSLLEVILASAVLLASSVILCQLLGIGREHAFRSEATTQAQILCQRTMNELLAGIVPFEPVADQEFPGDPEWSYSLDIEPLEGRKLLRVSITVTEQTDSEPTTTQPESRPRSFRLVRWLRSRPELPQGHSSSQPVFSEGG